MCGTATRNPKAPAESDHLIKLKGEQPALGGAESARASSMSVWERLVGMVSLRQSLCSAIQGSATRQYGTGPLVKDGGVDWRKGEEGL